MQIQVDWMSHCSQRRIGRGVHPTMGMGMHTVLGAKAAVGQRWCLTASTPTTGQTFCAVWLQVPPAAYVRSKVRTMRNDG